MTDRSISQLLAIDLNLFKPIAHLADVDKQSVVKVVSELQMRQTVFKSPDDLFEISVTHDIVAISIACFLKRERVPSRTQTQSFQQFHLAKKR